MGYTKKDGGFDRRTSTGKNLDLASDVVVGVAKGAILAGEGVVLAGKGVAIAGKFVGKKIGEQIEKAKQKREEKKVYLRDIYIYI